MKKIKKIVALIVGISVLMSLISISYATFKSENDQGTKASQTAFDLLPDDTVVCHVMGIPVYKSEIDEYGIIHKDFEINSLCTRSTGLLTGNLASKHADETIYASMIQVYVGYSETNSIMYMHHDEAMEVANGFRSGASKEYVVVQALGSYGNGLTAAAPVYAGIAAIIGGVLWLDAAARESISNDLGETCGTTDHATLIKVTSQYGTFYNVSSWNGRTVYKPSSYEDSTSTITVTAVNCAHGSVW